MGWLIPHRLPCRAGPPSVATGGGLYSPVDAHRPPVLLAKRNAQPKPPFQLGAHSASTGGGLLPLLYHNAFEIATPPPYPAARGARASKRAPRGARSYVTGSAAAAVRAAARGAAAAVWPSGREGPGKETERSVATKPAARGAPRPELPRARAAARPERRGVPFFSDKDERQKYLGKIGLGGSLTL